MATTQSKKNRATHGRKKGTRKTGGQKRNTSIRPTRSSRSPQTSADVRGSAGHQGRGLTPREARLVAEYLMDLNGTQAAIRAGYSPQTANAQWATVEAKAACAAIVDDPVYRTKLMAAARARTLAPAVEVMLWHYAYGKPKERVEHSGHLDLIHGRT